jgi:hypothetical protein
MDVRRDVRSSKVAAPRRAYEADDRYDSSYDRKRSIGDASSADSSKKTITQDHAVKSIMKHMMDQMSAMKTKLVDLTDELEQLKEKSSGASASSSEVLFVTSRESAASGGDDSIQLLSSPHPSAKSVAVSDPGSKLRVSGPAIVSESGDGKKYMRVLDVSPSDGSIHYLYISTDDIEPGSYSAFP